VVDAVARGGIEAVATREPGGAAGANEIRALLLNGAPERWDAVSEALLMVAARRRHLVETVWPALERGAWVICDRFSDSTIAYQGYGGGVPRERLAELHRLIAGDFQPDLTLILDLPVEVGLERAIRRGGERRFEMKGTAFHERVRQGFQEIARSEPQRCVLIDARGDVGTVSEAILTVLRERLGLAA
jgi:dTMP kinase